MLCLERATGLGHFIRLENFAQLGRILMFGREQPAVSMIFDRVTLLPCCDAEHAQGCQPGNTVFCSEEGSSSLRPLHQAGRDAPVAHAPFRREQVHRKQRWQNATSRRCAWSFTFFCRRGSSEGIQTWVREYGVLLDSRNMGMHVRKRSCAGMDRGARTAVFPRPTSSSCFALAVGIGSWTLKHCFLVV